MLSLPLGGPLLAQEVTQPPKISDKKEAARQSPEPSVTILALGKEVYLARCAVCHNPEGSGGADAALSLVANYRLRDDTKTIMQILNGGQYMPGFSFLLGDAEVAAVATYIRNSWNNHHGLVSEAQVAELR